MEEPKVLGPGEVETVKGPDGTYERYYLSDEKLQKYRDMPKDTFWDHHAKPNMPPNSIPNRKEKVSK
ncbi:hypothetical protein [Paenibacillus donghaensis]|uniref:Uncharacterized protein n=1 Tax=Paenibacillus donghaensis TaxID=414771 RepID=A0A2Z2KD17_9BACL|nr:hypothetical protein [Paenibacillus donghaensis]ASA20910.1 hypothetical protein B9T62_09005 [Paenibacillus donghaensis]